MEDSAVVTVGFENGACGVVSVIRGGTCEKDTLYIQGTKGTIRSEKLNLGNIIINGPDSRSEETLPPDKIFHLPLIESFADSVAEKRRFEVDGHIGLRVQEIITATYDRN